MSGAIGVTTPAQVFKQALALGGDLEAFARCVSHSWLVSSAH